MRKIILMLSVLITAFFAHAQDVNTLYDKQLADSLGADDYGMRTYVLVILKSGPNKVTDKAKRDSLFGGHLKNIQHLADIGKLTVAGPLKKNEKEYEGIFILNVKTKEEARQLLLTDPAIQAKALDTELFEWYGTAALPLYLPYYKRIEKKHW
jgi:uncharacterized protein YciI